VHPFHILKGNKMNIQEIIAFIGLLIASSLNGYATVKGNGLLGAIAVYFIVIFAITLGQYHAH